MDAASAVAHLRDRGIIPSDTPASVLPLSGGVSSVVLLVTSAGRALVVKQALPRLLVSRTWLADPDRTVTEGRALRLAADIDSAWVPSVVDLDEVGNVLVIEAAGPGAQTWKEALLSGTVDSAVASALGTFLATLHRGTAVGDGRVPESLAPFERDEAFAQLRVRPYFEAIAAARPALEALLMPAVREMGNRPRCLVHGDVSPKNVLRGDSVRWLIDWEVAHLGDPAFDLAFLCTHLLLKSILRPQWAARYHAAALGFLAEYRSGGGIAADDAHLCALTGALLIARVDGHSPVEYLDVRGQDEARRLGVGFAEHPASSLTAAIAPLREHARE